MADVHKVSVVDVNSRPLPNTQVSLGALRGQADPAGWTAELTLGPARPTTLEVDPPLEEGFGSTDSHKVLDQGTEVLPTEQVVAIEYDPAAHQA